MGTPTPRSLRAQANKLERKTNLQQKEPRFSFSKMVMAGIMMMFFVGVGLGLYVTVKQGEPVSVTLDFIMELARIATLGYFVKAFGENIAKIVLSAVFGAKYSDTNNEGGTGSG